MIYRNVYLKSNLPKFSGREPIYYFGKIVTNADKNGSLTREFDRSQDLYIGCNCDTPKYSAIIKKTKNDAINMKINQKRDINYVKNCRKCSGRRF